MFVDLTNNTEAAPWVSSVLPRLVLASECPERLASLGLTSLSTEARFASRTLVTTLINTGPVTGDRRGRFIKAEGIGRLWPQHKSSALVGR